MKVALSTRKRSEVSFFLFQNELMNDVMHGGFKLTVSLNTSREPIPYESFSLDPSKRFGKYFRRQQ